LSANHKVEQKITLAKNTFDTKVSRKTWI